MYTIWRRHGISQTLMLMPSTNVMTYLTTENCHTRTTDILNCHAQRYNGPYKVAAQIRYSHRKCGSSVQFSSVIFIVT